MNALALVLIAASCFLAAGGGLGGGALLVPIYLVVAKLEAHQAIGLSNFTICAGALASFFVNVCRQHPTRPGSIIDWNMVLMLEPLTVLGAMVGGYVNKVQPPWLTTLVLGALLCIMSGVLGRKARQQMLVERHAREAQRNCTGTQASLRSPIWVHTITNASTANTTELAVVRVNSTSSLESDKEDDVFEDAPLLASAKSPPQSTVPKPATSRTSTVEEQLDLMLGLSAESTSTALPPAAEPAPNRLRCVQQQQHLHMEPPNCLAAGQPQRAQHGAPTWCLALLLLLVGGMLVL